jgi:hypothetical protein
MSSADATMSEEIMDQVPEPQIRKMDVLMSPQDVIIACKGETIQTHSIVLRRCKYFATLLDNAVLDSGGAGPGNLKIIPLPATFDHEASEVREFIMVLYDTIEVAGPGAVLPEQYIGRENVFMLAELAHYFDAPFLHAECDKALASKHLVWFPRPDKLPWLMQVATKTHLPLLRASCLIKLATNIHGSRLLVHFDQGRGGLCKDPVFVTDLVTILDQYMQKYAKLRAMVSKLQQEGPGAICRALHPPIHYERHMYSTAYVAISNDRAHVDINLNEYRKCFQLIIDTLKTFEFA